MHGGHVKNRIKEHNYLSLAKTRKKYLHKSITDSIIDHYCPPPREDYFWAHHDRARRPDLDRRHPGDPGDAC